MLKRRLITSALAAALAAVAFVPAGTPAGASTTSPPCESFFHGSALSDSTISNNARKEGNSVIVRFYLSETQGEVVAEAPNCDAMSYGLYVEQWGATTAAAAEDLWSASYIFKPKTWPMTIGYSGVQTDYTVNSCGGNTLCPTAQRYVEYTVSFDTTKFPNGIPALCINATAANGTTQTDYLPTPGAKSTSTDPPMDGDEHRVCFASQAAGGWGYGGFGNIIL